MITRICWPVWRSAAPRTAGRYTGIPEHQGPRVSSSPAVLATLTGGVVKPQVSLRERERSAEALGAPSFPGQRPINPGSGGIDKEDVRIASPGLLSPRVAVAGRGSLGRRPGPWRGVTDQSRTVTAVDSSDRVYR